MIFFVIILLIVIILHYDLYVDLTETGEIFLWYNKDKERKYYKLPFKYK